MSKPPHGCIVLLLALCLLLTVGGAGAQEGAASASAADSGRFAAGFFRYQGAVRRFSLYIPAGHDLTVSLPLVVLLNNAVYTGQDTVHWLGWDTLADREQFYILAPETSGDRWNTGSAIIYLPQSPTDDAGFILSLIDSLAVSEHVAIDSERVYLAGIASGGMMAYRMACQAPRHFAAVAAVLATLPINIARTCSDRHYTRVLVMLGTEDPDALWNGVDAIYWGSIRPVLLSALDSVVFWVVHNVCDPAPIRYPPLDTADDGTVVHHLEYSGCADDAGVVFYFVEGGGHVWPGAETSAVMGRATQELNATEAIWRFFAGASSPPEP